MAVVKLPSFASLQSGDVVALKLQNAGAATLQGGVTTFGQVLEQGALPKGGGMLAEVGGKTVSVQVDVKTTYADGSAKMVVVSLERPDMAAGSSLDVVLSRGPASSAPAIDFARALGEHSFKVDMTPVGGTTTSIDVLSALKTAMANGTASFWQKGEFATEARVSIDLPGSQRMIFDVTAYKGGGFSVDAQFNNDDAMQATGGRVSYALKATLDGKVVANESVTQTQYQNWHENFTVGTSGGQGLGSASSGWLNIQQNTTYLAEIGAIADYDFRTGVSTNQMAEFGAAIQRPDWGDPLAANGVTKYMPMTGGRGDIGITTEANTSWLMTQDIRAAQYALGQADTASAVPMHFWDAAHGVWLNTDHYPNLWLDGRGGTGRPGDANSGTLTQGVDGSSGWAYETAHQPDLSYVPYILTGERWIMDNVMAQASASIMNEWPAPRMGAADLVSNGSQARSIAWSLRQIDEAAYIAPDDSADRAFFKAASESNWKFLVSKIPEWTAMQGEAYGWVPSSYGVKGALPPWQQDYFASTAIAAASRGNADALTFLKWEMNFLVGRFHQEGNGLAEHDGASYLLAISDPSSGRIYKTWAEIGQQTVARNWSNGDGWSKMDGDYGQLALSTLAGIYVLTNDARAKAAYESLLADGIRFSDQNAFAHDPTYNIAPPGTAGTTSPGNPTPQDPTPPSPPPPVVSSPTNTTIGSGPDTLVLKISEDAFNGHAKYTIKVDGVQVGGTLTASASHALGQSDVVTIKGSWGAAAHKIEVNFLNDEWGGTADTDRNLYVDGITYGGKAVPSSTVAIKNTGGVSFNTPPLPTTPVPPPVIQPTPGDTTIGTGPDTLVVRISEDAWEGHAQYTIKVDGKQIGGIHTASASHKLGQVETLTVKGTWGGTPHKVEVSFLNDGWGGTAATDRNLYVEGITYNGLTVPSSKGVLEKPITLAFTTPVVPAGPTSDSTPKTITGDNQDNYLAGGSGNDVISGLGGNDRLAGGAGNDTLLGGAGNDVLDGGQGKNLLDGGAGNDTYLLENLSDVILEKADAGTDLVITGLTGIVMAANVENLELTGIAVKATGNLLDNVMKGNTVGNDMRGGAGNDRLFGLEGNDRLDGGAGDDYLDGGIGTDRLIGGAGNDTFLVDNVGDVLTENAGDGFDTALVSVSGYTLAVHVEQLTLTGQAVSAFGNNQANVLLGNDAANLLNGMGSADTIKGGAGNDTIIGGLGFDKLTGDAGSDSFRYATASEGGDVITDFRTGVDMIEVSARGFGGKLDGGDDVLGASQFTVNNTGLATSPSGWGQFIFEADAAKLWWDLDGTGKAAPALIASFEPGTQVVASDIHIFG